MKKMLTIVMCCIGFTALAQTPKPDVVVTPNGPNTQVYWNAKFKTLILPHFAKTHIPTYQGRDTIGGIFVNTDPSDKHVYVKMNDGTYYALANVNDITPVDNTQFNLIALANGVVNLGNADSNNTDYGIGTTHTISFGKVLHSVNYLVVYSIFSMSSNPQYDLYHQITITAQTTTSFDIYFREAASFAQNIQLRWMIIPMTGY